MSKSTFRKGGAKELLKKSLFGLKYKK